ncbi:hypothetical protein DFJ63DRAFT_314942 [Scheffersomyces coipomensis]|uniref:uncharacterized protein n=1 Tax=Scheffersomyces coipomensis TaxID=1788519 RepID=UPI00315CC5B5
MSDYYEPTLLFRRNAKRFSPESSPMASVESLHSNTSAKSNSSSTSSNKSTSSSWMLNLQNPQDTQILNQSCSLNRLNIKSNYWKIPDNNYNLTSMAIKNINNDETTLAISSGNKESNLFIYDLNLFDNYLTHQSTISLPNIYGMKWFNSNYLITGNSKGYAHLVYIPHNMDDNQTNDDGEDQAEIIKRFNHRKHLKQKISSDKSSAISKLNIIPNQDHLISLYQNNLFYWDIKDCESQQRPSPISISKIHGIKNFEILNLTSSTIGICGNFGISLFDLRDNKFSVPVSSLQEHSKQKLNTNLIRVNPQNENLLVASHGDSVIRLWDIRKQNNYVNLIGHQNNVSSLQWNNGDLFSGGKDGNIIHWDLTTNMREPEHDEVINCSLKEGFDSINFNSQANKLETCLNQRQCGTLLPASNTNIIGMESLRGSGNDDKDLKVLSIDSSSFFGIHSKIYESINININSDKMYYTDDDIQLLINAQQSSLNTLVEEDEVIAVNETPVYESEMVKPLAVSRKSTSTFQPPQPIISSNQNMSNETLLDELDQNDFNQDSYKLDIDMSKIFDKSQTQSPISHEFHLNENEKEINEIKESDIEEDDDEFDFTQPQSAFSMYNLQSSHDTTTTKTKKSVNFSAYSIDSTEPIHYHMQSPGISLSSPETTQESIHFNSTTLDSIDTPPSSINSSPRLNESNKDDFHFNLLDDLDFNFGTSLSTNMFNEINPNNHTTGTKSNPISI